MATIPTLAVCCLCKQVTDTASSPEPWQSMPEFLERHHLTKTDVRLSHTYCPACYERQAQAWALPVKQPTSPARRQDAQGR